MNDQKNRKHAAPDPSRVEGDRANHPPLNPGETIASHVVDADGNETVTTTQTIMHNDADVQKAHQARVRDFALGIVADAIDRAVRAIAQNGGVIDEAFVSTVAYMPVTAAVEVSLKMEGEPYARRLNSRKVLNVCMDSIRRAQYSVRDHHEKTIDRLYTLTPQQQINLTAEIHAKAEAHAMLQQARARAEAERIASHIAPHLNPHLTNKPKTDA